MKKIYTLMFFCLLLWQGAQGQDSLRYTTLSVSVGVNNVRHKDAFESPYTYKGANLLVRSVYTRKHARGQHMVDLTYVEGTMESVISPEAKAWSIRLNYDYMVDLTKANARTKILPAVGVGLHTLFSNVRYLPEVEPSVNTLSSIAYLTVTGGARVRLNDKSSVSLRASVPVVGLVYRPDFEVNGTSLTRGTWAGESSLFSVNVGYNYAVTPKTHFIAGYQYSYFTYDKPRSIAVVQTGFSVGVRKVF